MTLSARERRIIAAVELDSERSAEAVAKQLGLKAHTVDYVLRSLRERGVMKKRAHVNSFQLGWRDAGIYFSLADRSVRRRDALLHRIIAHPRVTYLGSLLGTFSHVAVLRYEELSQVKVSIQEMMGRQGNVFAKRQIAPRMMGMRFARKFLAPEVSQCPAVVFSQKGRAAVLDEIDRKLLHVLANLGFESLREVGRGLAISPSTLDGRVKRLRAANVLKNFYYHLSYQELPVEAFRLVLSAGGVSARGAARLVEYCRKHPHIVYFVEALGAWDYEIGVEAESAVVALKIVDELWALLGKDLSSVEVCAEVEDLKIAPFAYV